MQAPWAAERGKLRPRQLLFRFDLLGPAVCESPFASRVLGTRGSSRNRSSRSGRFAPPGMSRGYRPGGPVAPRPHVRQQRRSCLLNRPSAPPTTLVAALTPPQAHGAERSASAEWPDGSGLDLAPPPDIRIALAGARGSGKSQSGARDDSRLMHKSIPLTWG